MTSTSVLGQFRSMVMVAFERESNPTEEIIERRVQSVRSFIYDNLGAEISDSDVSNIVLEVKSNFGVRMEIGHFLASQESDFTPWLDAKRDGIDWFYWKRYRQLLVNEGYPKDVVTALQERVDKTLSLMGDPTGDAHWDRRGMVVGNVQSGKTSNYIALAAMAADAGYKAIVIIAGIHNNLRNQTQERVDKGLVGRDSTVFARRGRTAAPRDAIVGVGHIDGSRVPTTYTNKVDDFSRRLVGVNEQLDPERREPYIFVIKKNPRTLENLIHWLRSNSSRTSSSISLPLLVVDDEADNASINIAYNKNEISTINRLLRELLGLFSRSTYIGYTATPFANIFIDSESDGDFEDLFPRDFIISLDPPTNYFGPDKIFLSKHEINPWLRSIDDWHGFIDPKHKKDYVPTCLSGTLQEAIQYFVLAVTIRSLRGDDQSHNSMLINISRFVDVQNSLRYRVQEYLEIICSAITAYSHSTGEGWLNDTTMMSLYATFDKECRGLDCKWEEILPALAEAARSIRICVINQRSPDSLDYSQSARSFNVIAIGGQSLSRGLTLEGLCVSYFLRNSVMYDTLMQMGRWFGYRPRYEDLCRVWMTDEAMGWFEHIAESTMELKDEFLQMERDGLNPSQFGLAVRSHPGALLITARNKLGVAQASSCSISLAERFIETHTVHADRSINESNLNICAELIEAASSHLNAPLQIKQHHKFSGLLLTDVECGPILSFLSRFDVHPVSKLAFGQPLQNYIRKRSTDELRHWDVFIVSKDNGMACPRLMGGINIGLSYRTIGREIACSNEMPWGFMIGSRQKVSGRGIEKIGLSLEEVDGIKCNAGKSDFSDRLYRQVPNRKPLLVLHLLELHKQSNDTWSFYPVPTFSISLPSTQLSDKNEEYFVNKVWLEALTGESADEWPDAADDIPVI